MLSQDPEITALVDSTDIAILPSLNPDGFSVARKGSCSGGRRGDQGQNNFNNVRLLNELEIDKGSYTAFAARGTIMIEALLCLRNL